MSPGFILETRIELLRRQLTRAQEALSDVTGPEWSGRSVNLALQSGIEQRINGLRPNLAWSDFLEAQPHCREILRECLAYIQGVLTRRQNLDDGICSIADAFLAELGQHLPQGWNRLTMLADNESWTDLVDMIRLRFPCGDLWELPVAAHEFGHFVARRIGLFNNGGSTLLNFDDYLAQGKTAPIERETQQWFHYQEYFADAFAVYSTGPAYLAACMFLRLQISTKTTRTHPSDADRGYFLLEMLRTISRPNCPDGLPGAWLEDYGDDWEKLQKAAGASALSSERRVELALLAREFSDLFNPALAKLRLRRAHEINLLKYDLEGDGQTSLHDLNFAEILNAAWLARLNNPERSDQLGQRAAELCFRLSKDRESQALPHA